MQTLYEHAGGEMALRQFIDIFYGHVLADPLLQPLFGKGQPDHVDHPAASFLSAAIRPEWRLTPTVSSIRSG
jgi:truncated hemoglobin YjbI